MTFGKQTWGVDVITEEKAIIDDFSASFLSKFAVIFFLNWNVNLGKKMN